MKYYVVGEKVTIGTASLETVRDGLVNLAKFNGFKTKEAAEQLAAYGQHPNAKTAYAVYEISVEGEAGLYAREFKMKGQTHQGFKFKKAELQNFELVSASFKGNDYNYAKEVAAPVVPVDTTVAVATPVDTTVAVATPVDTTVAVATPVDTTVAVATPVDTTVANPATPVDTTVANPATPVDTAVANPEAPEEPVATTTRLEKLKALADKYRRELLAGAGYALATTAVVVAKVVPTVATFAVAKGFTVPAALLATTATAPVVAAAAVATAATFGLGYASSLALTAIASKVKAAYTRYKMNAQQRHEADYPVAKQQLAQLKDALADKTAEDNTFLEQLHAFKKNAVKPTFDAEGKATQDATVVTRPVVVQFEIEAMKRLNKVAADKRAETEAALLQEARANFTPAAN